MTEEEKEEKRAFIRSHLKDIVPTGWHVLIEVDAVEKKSSGGIVLAKSESDFKRMQGGRETGRVLALGSQVYDDCPNHWVKVGDTVFFKRYSGTELRFPWMDAAFFCVNDKDIYLKLTPELAKEVE